MRDLRGQSALPKRHERDDAQFALRFMRRGAQRLLEVAKLVQQTPPLTEVALPRRDFASCTSVTFFATVYFLLCGFS